MTSIDTPSLTLRRALGSRRSPARGPLKSKVIYRKTTNSHLVVAPGEPLMDDSTEVFSFEGGTPGELVRELVEGVEDYGLSPGRTTATLRFVQYLANQFDPEGVS